MRVAVSKGQDGEHPVTILHAISAPRPLQDLECIEAMVYTLVHPDPRHPGKCLECAVGQWCLDQYSPDAARQDFHRQLLFTPKNDRINIQQSLLDYLSILGCACDEGRTHIRPK
jgi:hypothetical protein